MTARRSPWVAQLHHDGAALPLFDATLHLHRVRFLIRCGVTEGQRCIVVGPGAASVSVLLMELVGPAGGVVCFDPSAEDVRAARASLSPRAAHNVTLEVGDVNDLRGLTADVVYALRCFTGTTHPQDVASLIGGALTPGGTAVVEEIDVEAAEMEPASGAFSQWVALSSRLVWRTGGDPRGARKAASNLLVAGMDVVELEVVQPAFASGHGKYLPLAAFESARALLIEAGLITPVEAHDLWHDLRVATAEDQRVVYWPSVVFVGATSGPTVDAVAEHRTAEPSR